MLGKRNKKRIYMDYAATTPVDKRVIREMNRYWDKEFANPGAIHKDGVMAKHALEQAREKIAGFLQAHPDEIIFTSSGTESNNLAIFGFVNRLEKEGIDISKYHFITSKIEHPSAMDAFRELERRGASVSYIGVTKEGILDLEEFKNELSDNTLLVSIIYANNEIGTIQPMLEIAKIIRRHRKSGRGISVENREIQTPLFHTDSSQAIYYFDVNVGELWTDLLVLDAQKMYGPKGIGALYIKRGTPISSVFYGGEQERSLRPGTPNIPAIVGFAKSYEIAEEERKKEAGRLTELRDYFIGRLQESIPEVRINGDLNRRLPNNISISIPDIDSELLVLELDARGISVSSRSACKRDELNDSYVIMALYGDISENFGTVRFSMGKATTKKNIDYIIFSLIAIIKKSKSWKT